MNESTRKIALLAMTAAGGAWLFIPQIHPYINWGHTIPLWPFIAWLGLSIAARWHAMTALLAGILAAMNPGWLLMLPVLGIYLWRESGPRFPAIALAMIFFPLVSYGANREYFFDMMKGILGNAFRTGGEHDKLNAWRYISLHALGDFFNLRYGIYLLGLAALGAICIQLWKRDSRSERIQLVALAGFVIVLCGPQAYFFHWAGHCVLLASLIPAVVLANGTVYTEQSARIFRGFPLMAGGAAAVACFALLFVQFSQGFDGTIDQTGSQRPTEHLLSGFNIPSADHAWGKDTAMEVGFTLDQVKPGMLEVKIGTIGGDFAPYNPVRISVNGHRKGIFRTLPGETRYVRIPIKPGELHVGYNVMEMETNWARTPKSLNAADDHRTVSISYGGLAYIPAKN